MRYFARCKYNGTDFHGWQSQKNTPNTIQGKIEDAMAVFMPERIEVVGCGRTDAGVHASDFFFHFDYQDCDPIDLRYKLNSLLPYSIYIGHIIPVHDDAHTRFDASKRAYEYHLIERPDPFRQDTTYFLPTLNRWPFELMQEAAALLIDYEDFDAFCKNGSDEKTKKCTIFLSEWVKTKNGYIYHIEANRFLRGMIRMIVGMCINVAKGKLTIHEVKSALENQERLKTDWSVPARGLFLSKIQYDYILDNKYIPLKQE